MRAVNQRMIRTWQNSLIQIIRQWKKVLFQMKMMTSKVSFWNVPQFVVTIFTVVCHA